MLHAAAVDGPAGPSVRPCTVAHIVRHLEVGGGEMVAARLAEHMDRDRFRSVVFCLRESGWLARELEAHGVRVVVFGAGEGASPALIPQLRAALRREAVDLVHCHNPMPLLYGGLAAATLAPRRPALLMTKHGMISWRGWRQATLARFLLRRATVAAVSREIGSALVEGRWVTAAQVRTIGNGIDPERYRPGNARDAVRSELGWPAGAFVIGCVARLAPEKNHALLLRAFARLPVPAEAPPMLALIGDGPRRAELGALAGQLGLGERCRFLGDRQDVERLLPALDLFSLSSDTEGTPLTLLEAMASGLPTVTTAVGGVPDVVRDGETGLLVPRGDAGALAEALESLAAAPERRGRMGAAGRARILEAYSLEQMARAYERLYDEILRRPCAS